MSFTANLTNPAGGRVAVLNRKGSDGEIVSFRKDGSTVGSIGTRAGYLRTGSGDTGLFFNPTSDEITPENIDDNTFRDAAIDLGTGAARFKNLYLSGGVYLGGTGSDNLLNDYEIGTWNPTSGGAGTLTVNSGAYYTKVGRNVTLHINSAQFSDITSTSALGINGLPFAPSGSSAVGTTMMSYRDDTITIAPFIPATVSQIRFYQSSTTAGFLRVKHNILNSTSNALYVSITYQTA